MQFKRGADVVSKEDKKIGTLERVVLDPKSKEVAYLVAKSGFLLTEDKLISIDLVKDVTEDRISVDISGEGVQDLPTYEEVHYIRAEARGGEADNPEPYYWYPPAYGLHSLGQYPVFPQLMGVPVVKKNIPDNMVALKEGARVIAGDDEHVGNVEQLVLDESNDNITHLVVSSGVLLKERKLVPAYWLTDVTEDEVHLGVDSAFLNKLPDYHS